MTNKRQKEEKHINRSHFYSNERALNLVRRDYIGPRVIWRGSKGIEWDYYMFCVESGVGDLKGYNGYYQMFYFEPLCNDF